MSKRGNAAAMREVFHLPPTSGQFQYRQTGKDIFQVDQGDTHLGTVQKFSAGEWWAYPANSAGQTQFTAASRLKAAEALRDHHAANTSVVAFCADDTCPGCRGCTPPGYEDTAPVDPAESIGYRPGCRYPSRSNGDGRGCQMDDCPMHGGDDR